MRTTPLILSVLLLAGCSAGSSSSSSSDSSAETSNTQKITISFTRTEREDDQATQYSTGTLRFSGAVNKTVTLDEVMGQLTPVNADQNAPYSAPGKTTLLILSTWWAGSGDEIVVSRNLSNNTILIEKREGGEEGVCTAFETIAQFGIPKNVTFAFAGIPERLDQSSIAFCNNLE